MERSSRRSHRRRQKTRVFEPLDGQEARMLQQVPSLDGCGAVKAASSGFEVPSEFGEIHPTAASPDVVAPFRPTTRLPESFPELNRNVLGAGELACGAPARVAAGQHRVRAGLSSHAGAVQGRGHQVHREHPRGESADGLPSAKLLHVARRDLDSSCVSCGAAQPAEESGPGSADADAVEKAERRFFALIFAGFTSVGSGKIWHMQNRATARLESAVLRGPWLDEAISDPHPEHPPSPTGQRLRLGRAQCDAVSGARPRLPAALDRQGVRDRASAGL
eukprot:scaffold315_cov251-Pinguiococcus_pyrenoidosus.AAC.2